MEQSSAVYPLLSSLEINLIQAQVFGNIRKEIFRGENFVLIFWLNRTPRINLPIGRPQIAKHSVHARTYLSIYGLLHYAKDQWFQLLGNL